MLHQSSAVRKMLSSCVYCRKIRGRPLTQVMGELPPDRLHRTPPFYRSGVDVFGPYLVHDGRKTRGRPGSKKTWVLIFTCLYSRAIHVEMLSSIDTHTFQLALRRFFSVRGYCVLFRSDRGSNFMGAVNAAKEELKLADLVRDAGSESYTCKFLPAGASHMAGVWERKIGSIKAVFEATLAVSGSPVLSRDELHTLMLESASIVNNTPLGEVSSDPNEPFPVSPTALLTLRESPEPAQPFKFSQQDLLCYGRQRWRRVQLLADMFWEQWRRDYLYSLTQRAKWLNPQRNLQVGDVVLVGGEAPRNSWPMGLVHETHPGLDGKVRKATIRLSSNSAGRQRFLERPVHLLVLVLKVDECSKNL